MLRRGERLKRVKELREQPQVDSAGAQGVKGVIWDLAAFHKGKAVGEVPRRLEAEGKVSPLVGWRYIRQAFECPAFMIKKLCL